MLVAVGGPHVYDLRGGHNVDGHAAEGSAGPAGQCELDDEAIGTERECGGLQLVACKQVTGGVGIK